MTKNLLHHFHRNPLSEQERRGTMTKVVEPNQPHSRGLEDTEKLRIYGAGSEWLSQCSCKDKPPFIPDPCTGFSPAPLSQSLSVAMMPQRLHYRQRYGNRATTINRLWLPSVESSCVPAQPSGDADVPTIQINLWPGEA